MKKRFASLLVLVLPVLCALLLTSCSGVTEKKAAKDPLGILSSALEQSFTDFFSGGADAREVVEKAVKKGSFNLILATDELADNRLNEIDETLYFDQKNDTVVSDTRLTVAGTSYRATVWGDKNSIAIKSESLFGNKNTLLLTFDRFIAEFEDSALKTVGFSDKETQKLLEAMEYLRRSMDEKDPVIPEKDAEKLIKEICTILGQEVSTEEVAIGDASEAKHIVMTYTLDTEAVEGLCDLYLRVVKDYDIPAEDASETVESIKEELGDRNGKWEYVCKFYLNAKSGALARLDVEAVDPTVVSDSATDIGLDASLSLVFTEDALTLTGTVKTDGEEYTVDAKAEKTAKGDKTTYAFTATASRGNIDIKLLNLTYTYDAKSGAMTLVGSVAVDEQDRVELDIAATCKVTKKEVNFTVDSAVFTYGKEELFEFKKDRANELSLVVKVLDEIPAMDEGATNIMDMNKGDWEKLLDDFEKSDVCTKLFADLADVLF